MKKKAAGKLGFDPRNPNRGTKRGRAMVAHSLEEFGAGRSVLVDRKGRAIAGNKTLEAAQSLNLPTKVIETDGKTLIVVKRTDLGRAESQKTRGRG